MSWQQYLEAKQKQREIVEIRGRVLGKEHPDTLTSMSNLAGLLTDRLEYVEAEQTYREELKVRERVLGKENLDTLTSMNKHATVLVNQCQYEEVKKN